MKQHTFKLSIGQRGSLETNNKYIELSENESKTYQKLWGIAKAVLRWKFIVLNTYYIEKRKISNQ